MKITQPVRPPEPRTRSGGTRGASAPAPVTNHLPFGPAGEVLRERVRGGGSGGGLAPPC